MYACVCMGACGRTYVSPEVHPKLMAWEPSEWSVSMVDFHHGKKDLGITIVNL